MKYGIDISKHNKITDYAKAFSQIDFVMIRAGYGKHKSQIDAKLLENVKQAIKYNVPFGLYWYSYATTIQDALKEAETCYEIIKENKISPKFPVFIDIEDTKQTANTKTTNSTIVSTFCDFMKSKGIKTGFYTYHAFSKSYLNMNLLEGYDFWYANCNTLPDTIIDNYSIWQYSFTRKIDGIENNVDGDKMSDEYFKRNIKPTTYDALTILNQVVGNLNSDEKHTALEALRILQEVVKND